MYRCCCGCCCCCHFSSNLVMWGSSSACSAVAKQVPDRMYVTVLRDHALQDSVEQVLQAEPRNLRRSLHISFINESGLDAGGLTREWFHLVATQLFSEEAGLFTRANVRSHRVSSCSGCSLTMELSSTRLAGGEAVLHDRSQYNSVTGAEQEVSVRR